MNQPVFIDQLTTLMAGEVRQELAFPTAEYRRRVDRASAEMRNRGIDVLISTYLPNICYLTGYQFTNCDYAGFLVLHRDGRAAMVVPGTEVSTVLLHGWVRDVKDFPSWEPLKAIPLITGVIDTFGVNGEPTIGIETGLELMDLLTFDALRAALPSAQLVDATDLVSTMRRTLGRTERDHLLQASRYGDAGMRDALGAIAFGVTESAVAAAASREMIAIGSEFFSTAPLVAAGARTALPHAMFGRGVIAKGDPVNVELAAAYERYAVPLARTAVLGAPSDELQELASHAATVLTQLTDAVRPGRRVADAALAAREAVAQIPAQLWPIATFGHALSVGMPPTWQDDQLVLHEDSTELFAENMAFYSVVRLHIPGRHGVVIGDSWICKPNGVETLTALSRDLYVVATDQENNDA